MSERTEKHHGVLIVKAQGAYRVVRCPLRVRTLCIRVYRIQLFSPHLLQIAFLVILKCLVHVCLLSGILAHHHLEAATSGMGHVDVRAIACRLCRGHGRGQDTAPGWVGPASTPNPCDATTSPPAASGPGSNASSRLVCCNPWGSALYAVHHAAPSFPPPCSGESALQPYRSLAQHLLASSDKHSAPAMRNRGPCCVQWSCQDHPACMLVWQLRLCLSGRRQVYACNLMKGICCRIRHLMHSFEKRADELCRFHPGKRRQALLYCSAA